MASLEEAVVTTLFDQSGDVADECLHHNPLTATLKSKGKFRRFKGGYEIRKAVLMNDTAGGGFYSGYDSFNLANVTDLDAFQFDIRQLYEPFSISGRERRANTGEEQISDLVDQKMLASKSRLKNNFSLYLKGDGTAFSGRAFDGIKKMVSATPTSGTYGKITRLGNFYAQNQATSAIGFTAANVQAELTEGIMSITRGDDGPDMGFAHPAVWRHLHSSLTAIQRIQGETKKGMGGFKSKVLNYDGVDFYYDGGYGGSGGSGDSAAVVESGSVRLLNTEYITFDVDSQSDFKPLAPTMDRPVDQDAFFTIILVEGNLCCAAPNLQHYMV